MSTNPHQDPLHYLWHNGGEYSDSELWFIVSVADPKLVVKLLMWQPAGDDTKLAVWMITEFPELVAGPAETTAFTSATLQSWWNTRWGTIHWEFDYRLENAPQDLRDLLIDLGLTTTEW